MRIAVLAPITHPFPPQGYGPWELVAFNLVEGLVKLGHEVTVFAAAGSETSARLVPTVPEPIAGSGQDSRLVEARHLFATMELVADGGFQVLHSHLHVHALGFSRFLPTPIISTLHGSAWNQAHRPLLLAYKDQPYVSISDSERALLPELNYVQTVYNGIDFEHFALEERKEEYLLFAGRMAPEKAPDLAIEVARRSGRPLLLAGMREDRYRDFFTERVAPGLGGDIEYVGDITRSELARLLPKAAGLVMPLRWPEPFGLVVVEAFASGTPVIAWNQGAMPELIQEGENGFLVDSVEAAASASDRLGPLLPESIRKSAQARFSRDVMASGYSAVYQEVIKSLGGLGDALPG